MSAALGKRWTEAEDAIVAANIGRSYTEIAELIPGRSALGVERRARILCLVKPAHRCLPATPEEDAILRKSAGTAASDLRARLPNRSVNWIHNRRRELGVFRPNRRGDGGRYTDYSKATEATRVENMRKQLQPEGTAYRTRSGQPARIINRFPMPDVPSVYGGNHDAR
jgi:hypothetical protein